MADLDRIKNITKGHDFPCSSWRHGCKVCDIKWKEKMRRDENYTEHDDGLFLYTPVQWR